MSGNGEGYDIAVIGGGAAGMYCAAHLSRRGFTTVILEKNEKLGKKLFITGKGRCNFTNNCGRDEFFSSVVSNPRFLYSAYSLCAPQDVMRYFEDCGLAVKTERGKRVFPVSDRSCDVIDTLKEDLRKHHVQVLLHTRVTGICCEAGEDGRPRAAGVFLRREENGKEGEETSFLPARAVVVATGGLSYPSTGSTGDGYRFAEEAGHAVTERVPSLVPFRIRETDLYGSLAGLSPKNVRFTARCGGKTVFSETGEMLFTHEGISGPLVLSASAYARGRFPLSCEIDWKAAVPAEQFDRRLVGIISEAPLKSVRNALRGVYPASLIPVLLSAAGIPGEKKAGEITKEERARLVRLTKAMPLTAVSSGGFPEAVVTQGGVSVREIDPKTMESRRVSGLYFIGEVLDLDALTGGFNLQIAWMTAKACAENMTRQGSTMEND